MTTRASLRNVLTIAITALALVPSAGAPALAASVGSGPARATPATTASSSGYRIRKRVCNPYGCHWVVIYVD